MEGQTQLECNYFSLHVALDVYEWLQGLVGLFYNKETARSLCKADYSYFQLSSFQR